MTTTGLVTISFSEPMMVPSLDLLQKAKVRVDGIQKPVFELKVKLGYYSDESKLGFTFNITSYTPQQMLV